MNYFQLSGSIAMNFLSFTFYCCNLPSWIFPYLTWMGKQAKRRNPQDGDMQYLWIFDKEIFCWLCSAKLTNDVFSVWWLGRFIMTCAFQGMVRNWTNVWNWNFYASINQLLGSSTLSRWENAPKSIWLSSLLLAFY